MSKVNRKLKCGSETIFENKRAKYRSGNGLGEEAVYESRGIPKEKRKGGREG